jgi:hypothetical protein
VTAHGAATVATTKLAHLAFNSSTEAEMVGTVKGCEAIDYGRDIERAFGEAMDEPTVVACDNKSNVLVSSGAGSASRLKHCMRRFETVKQRVAQGKVVLAHVPDPQNPADYLTKFVGREKVRWSNEFATNARNAVPYGARKKVT